MSIVWMLLFFVQAESTGKWNINSPLNNKPPPFSIDSIQSNTSLQNPSPLPKRNPRQKNIKAPSSHSSTKNSQLLYPTMNSRLPSYRVIFYHAR